MILDRAVVCLMGNISGQFLILGTEGELMKGNIIVRALESRDSPFVAIRYQ